MEDKCEKCQYHSEDGCTYEYDVFFYQQVYDKGRADEREKVIEEVKKNIEHMMYETAFNCMEDKMPTTYSDVLLDCVKRLDGWFTYVKEQLMTGK